MVCLDVVNLIYHPKGGSTTTIEIPTGSICTDTTIGEVIKMAGLDRYKYYSLSSPSGCSGTLSYRGNRINVVGTNSQVDFYEVYPSCVVEIYATIYNSEGEEVDDIYDYDFGIGDNPTIGDLLATDVCKNAGITELSLTKGGEALSHSAYAWTSGDFDMGNSPSFYATTSSGPTPATSLTAHGHIDTLHMRYVQGTATDYSAMRGPCPEGFHIPLASEWSSLRSAPGTGSNFATNLKIPLHAKYVSSSGNKGQSGESRYHCADKGQNLVCKGSAWLDTSRPIGDGLPIRAFKDVPVVPDSSWDVIFDLSAIVDNAGIFRNQTMGLISISSDGINWLTIQDKNLGATNVGDTGYYYQWGNGHGFNWEKQTVTSSTQIDASTYGPNNYYSSSTFITADQRDSSDNKNLRGGVTGIVPSEGHREPVYYGPQITLLSYEEILAMDGNDKADDIVAVLNEHPLEYYNKLSSEGHLILDTYHTGASDGYAISDTNNDSMIFDGMSSISKCGHTYIGYILSTGLRDYYCSSEPI